jgi:hypothetical protein
MKKPILGQVSTAASQLPKQDDPKYYKAKFKNVKTNAIRTTGDLGTKQTFKEVSQKKGEKLISKSQGAVSQRKEQGGRAFGNAAGKYSSKGIEDKEGAAREYQATKYKSPRATSAMSGGNLNLRGKLKYAMSGNKAFVGKPGVKYEKTPKGTHKYVVKSYTAPKKPTPPPVEQDDYELYTEEGTPEVKSTPPAQEAKANPPAQTTTPTPPTKTTTPPKPPTTSTNKTYTPPKPSTGTKTYVAPAKPKPTSTTTTTSTPATTSKTETPATSGGSSTPPTQTTTPATPRKYFVKRNGVVTQVTAEEYAELEKKKPTTTTPTTTK